MLSEHVFPHALLQKRILCEVRGKKEAIADFYPSHCTKNL
jgi:hypothetical protein